MTRILSDAWRFALVGIVATIIHVLTALLLAHVAGLGAFWANLCAFIVAWSISYLGNDHLTFRSGAHWSKTAPRFLIVSLFCLVLNQVFVLISVGHFGWSFPAALAVVVTLVPLTSFILSRRWVFRAPRTPAAATPGGPDMSTPGQGTLRTPWLLIALSLVLAAAFGLRLTSSLNHDTSWYLYATGRLLDGATLYTDIYEVNPPLAFLLTVPPVFAAKLAALNETLVFYAYVFVLICASTVVAACVVDRDRKLSPSARRAIVLVSAAALALVPAGDFGQREHLAVIFASPYLLLVALRLGGTTFPVAAAAGIGVLSFVGFGLKPHFLLAPLAAELLMLVRRRNLLCVFRAETLALAAAVMTYPVVVYLVTPEYLTHVVPFALEVYNSAFNNPMTILLFLAAPYCVIAGLLVVGMQRSDPDSVRYSATFVTAAVAFLAVYAVQQKGWSYQLVPAKYLLTVAGAVLLGASIQRFAAGWAKGPRVSLSALKPVGPTALCVVFMLVQGAADFRYHNDFLHMKQEVRAAGPGVESVFVFSSNVSAAFPMVNEAGVDWSSRFPTQWLLPGLARNRTATEQRPILDKIERYAVQAVVTDFTRRPPDLVFVDMRDDKPYFGGVRFDYVAYFSRDPRFRTIWSRYVRIKRLGEFDVYRRARETVSGAGSSAGY